MGTEVPWRLHFQTLRVAFFHGQLRKVKVMLKVDRKTDCTEIERRIDLSGRDVQIFYVADMIAD
jgi:hypothetical protein